MTTPTYLGDTMQINRRSFLKLTGISLAALPFASSLFSPPPARAADLPMAKETDPMPKSLKYCSNAKKPTAHCADRKKKEKADQFCHNCQLFTKLDDKKGKCMLITGAAVAYDGWCNSWVKKPGT